MDAIRRQVDELNLSGNIARAVNKPEDLRDVAHDIQQAMTLSQQATEAMREAESAILQQLEAQTAKALRIQRRKLRALKGTHGTV